MSSQQSKLIQELLDGYKCPLKTRTWIRVRYYSFFTYLITCLLMRYGPVRFTLIILFHSSSVCSSMLLPVNPMPALFTRTFIELYLLNTYSTAFITLCSMDTPALMNTALRPFEISLFSLILPASSSMSIIAMLYSSNANLVAMVASMSLAPPVTIQVLS